VAYAAVVYLVAVVVLGGTGLLDQAVGRGRSESGEATQLGLTFAGAALVALTLSPLNERLSRMLPEPAEDQLARLTSGRSGAGDPGARLDELVRLVSSALGPPAVTRITASLGAELTAVWQWPEQGGLEVERTAPFVRRLVSGADRAPGDLSVLGELSVRTGPGRMLTPVEHRLLDQAAHHAALLLGTARMDVTLQRLLAESAQRHRELSASRSRILSAMEEERRRVERDIHDGAQQHLVALTVNLQLLRVLVDRDPDRARATAARVHDAVVDTIETLNRLSAGLYPPLLAEAGPVVALRAAAEGTPVPVVVQGDAGRRWSAPVEAAAYFSCLEALQNALKHADAGRIVVTVTSGGEDLGFEVSDDGRGFDTALVLSGSGTANLRDRIAALGGTLSVISTVGRGTTVTGWLPASGAPPEVRGRAAESAPERAPAGGTPRESLAEAQA
jgi:signal transduction histidine kinase